MKVTRQQLQQRQLENRVEARVSDLQEKRVKEGILSIEETNELLELTLKYKN